MESNNPWSSIKSWILGKAETSEVSPGLSSEAIRKFYLPVVKSGELWCVVNDKGWVKPMFSYAGESPRAVWSTREAAEESAHKEKGAVPKSISLQRFLYELLDDWIEDNIPVLINWNGTPDHPTSDAKLVKLAIETVAEKYKLPLPSRLPEISTAAVKERTASSITFAVDEVAAVCSPMRKEKMYAALKKRLSSELESCCDYHSEVVAGIEHHPLIGAVDAAFNQHRPLVLTPDVVWLAIAQGLSHHIQKNAESLRSKFVSHEGKLELEVRCDGFVKGSPENLWDKTIGSFSTQIKGHLSAEVHSLFVADFSTTGPTERIASEVVLMEAFQHYFDYVAVCICGIPQITLTGTVEDWQRIRARIDAFEQYGLDWWLIHLRPICDEFVRAARGEINLKYWRRIFKSLPDYGTNQVSGWIGKLIPYLADQNGIISGRNPMLSGETVSIGSFPKGLSQAPFKLSIGPLENPKVYPMEFIAGFVGVAQDENSFALRPKIGWAVRDADLFDQMTNQIANAHELKAPTKDSFPEFRDSCPGELFRYFDRCDGANLFTKSGSPQFVLSGRRECKSVHLIQKVGALRFEQVPADYQWTNDIDRTMNWLLIAKTRQGGRFFLDLEPERHPRKQDHGQYDANLLWRIVFCPDDDLSSPLDCRVVAYSLTGLLELLLRNGDKPFMPEESAPTVAESIAKAEELWRSAD